MLRRSHAGLAALVASIVCFAGPVRASDDVSPTDEHAAHGTPAGPDSGPATRVEPAALPEGTTLDEVLEQAQQGKPEDFPDAIMDDQLRGFVLVEQLEYRIDTGRGPDSLGWESQGWVGYDFDRFWWKNEGEAAFDGSDEGESETDLLYSRLVAPFWSVQLGAQYANDWSADDYADRWSGVLAVQGLAPYKFEVDGSLYVSEKGDVTFELETEYDLRITQRLVLQPRAETHLAFQDIRERALGAGLTDVNLDLRLRYEIRRELAPYVGLRFRTLVGQTEDIAQANGEDVRQLYLIAGVRFAF